MALAAHLLVSIPARQTGSSGSSGSFVLLIEVVEAARLFRCFQWFQRFFRSSTSSKNTYKKNWIFPPRARTVCQLTILNWRAGLSTTVIILLTEWTLGVGNLPLTNNLCARERLVTDERTVCKRVSCHWRILWVRVTGHWRTLCVLLHLKSLDPGMFDVQLLMTRGYTLFLVVRACDATM